MAKATSLTNDDVAKEGGEPPIELPAADIDALVARGDSLLQIGDIVSARLFYERAADGGGAGAAVKLGKTFDPVFVKRTYPSGISADVQRAMFWYSRASDLGSIEGKVLVRQFQK